MLPKNNPIRFGSWKKLENIKKSKTFDLRTLFKEDPERADRFSLSFGDIFLDYSKNLIDEDVMKTLFELAGEAGLREGTAAMFSGEKINETEKRAVLHTALRDFSDDPIILDCRNIKDDIRRVQSKMKAFADKVSNKKWLGFSGKPVTDIVNIGIGGSDLGPVMVTEALKPFWKEGLRVFFVSNIDGTHIAETLKQLKPETTLFLIASKTFTTLETMTNANTAKKWFLENGGSGRDIAKH
ncbi:glucose-6-phosphate isomerase, partial [bacterium]|nr:glucose-6-phosphate isomerase [bacterium]